MADVDEVFQSQDTQAVSPISFPNQWLTSMAHVIKSQPAKLIKFPRY